MIEERFLVLDDKDEHKTDSRIAENIGVSEGLVHEVRSNLLNDQILMGEDFATQDDNRSQAEEYVRENPDASNRDIADNTPVSRTTAGTIKNEIESEADDGNDDDNSDGNAEVSERSDGHTSPSDDGRGIDDDTPSSDGATPIDVSQDSQTDTDTDDGIADSYPARMLFVNDYQ